VGLPRRPERVRETRDAAGRGDAQDERDQPPLPYHTFILRELPTSVPTALGATLDGP